VLSYSLLVMWHFSLLSSMEEIDMAFREAESGISSKRPVIEMTIPSVLDKTISPPGMHIYYSLVVAVG
jgi:phytoene dehydrogenase-like protein